MGGIKNAYGTIVSAQSALLSTAETDGLTGENVQAALARSFSTSCCNPSEIEQMHLWELIMSAVRDHQRAEVQKTPQKTCSVSSGMFSRERS